MALRLIVFLLLNFAALGLGGLLSGSGSQSSWYQNLNVAPWTPPGWVFGAAWFTIMVCFSFYMAMLWKSNDQKTTLIWLFAIQWILNIIWNPVFFKYHLAWGGLIIIILLTILVGYFLFRYLPELKYVSLLILPYFIWLLIASSLNAYAAINN